MTIHVISTDARVIGKKRFMMKVKRMSKKKNVPTNTVISKCLRNTKKSVKAVIPPPKQLKNMINRIRKNPDLPANPNTLSELVLSQEICATEGDENFLLFDSGTIVNDDESEKRLVMFGTKSNLNYLAECGELFMDGTFTVTPRLFKQLYTIHGKFFCQKIVIYYS